MGTPLNEQFRGGIEVLRNHDPEWGQLETRKMRYGVEMRGLDEGLQPELANKGDINIATFWPAESRPLHGWSYGWPATVVGSGARNPVVTPGDPQGPTTPRDAPPPVTTPSDPVAAMGSAAKGAGGTTVPVQAAPGGSVEPGLRPPSDFGEGGTDEADDGGDLAMLPIYASSYAPDAAFQVRPIARRPGWPKIPTGTVGTVMAGSVASRHSPVFLHGDPRMLAVNEGDSPSMGSLVYDTDGAGGYGLGARLQSAWRVIPTIIGRVSSNGPSLAWQLCDSRRDRLAGYGTFIDRHAIGGEGGGQAGVVGGQDALVVAFASARVSGPLEVGHEKGDEHALSFSGTRRVNAGHIQAGALFYAGRSWDAPLEFQLRKYPNPSPLPGISRVHLVYDQAKTHNWFGGTAPGLWRWYAEVPFAAVPPVPPKPPPTTPPREPPITPPTTPPFPPPTTPPDPPPRGPTTPVGFTAGGGSQGSGAGGGGGFGPASLGAGSPLGGRGPVGGIGEQNAIFRSPLVEKARKLGGSDTPGEGGDIAHRTFDGDDGRTDTGGGFRPFGGEFGPPEPKREPEKDPLFGPDGPKPPDYPNEPIGPDGKIPPQTTPSDPEPTDSRIMRPDVRAWRPAHDATDGFISFPGSTGFNVLLFRPQNMTPGYPDLRNTLNPRQDILRWAEDWRPVVLRAEPFGAERAGQFQRQSGRQRFYQGTAAGGLLFMPPQLDLFDTERSDTLPSTTTPYVAAFPGVWFGAGYPVRTTGDLKSGARWGLSGGEFLIQGLSSASVATTAFRVKTSGIAGVRETGGPTMLDFGAIADGETVKRSGSTLVGYTPSSGPSVLARVSANQAVGPSSTTETTVFGPYTVAANSMSTNKLLRLWLKGTLLNNSGSGVVRIRLRVKFGGAEVLSVQSGNLAINAARRAMQILVNVQNTATNAQQGTADILFSDLAALTTGEAGGPPEVTASRRTTFTSATDTTANADLEVTLELSLSDASFEADVDAGVLELV